MTVEEILYEYLPMERKTCYLLLGVMEPCKRNEVCQTVSELSNGEFDFEENLTQSLLDLTEKLENDGLLQGINEDGSEKLVISELGMKLLVCEFNRLHWLERQEIS